MYDMVNKYSSISLEDLEKEIAINYQISVPFDKLRGYLYSTDIFYSDILGKIYSDNESFPNPPISAAARINRCETECIK